MTDSDILSKCIYGDRVMDIMSGEELKFISYTPNENSYVMLADVKGMTVWLQPDRLELIKR